MTVVSSFTGKYLAKRKFCSCKKEEICVWKKNSPSCNAWKATYISLIVCGACKCRRWVQTIRHEKFIGDPNTSQWFYPREPTTCFFGNVTKFLVKAHAN